MYVIFNRDKLHGKGPYPDQWADPRVRRAGSDGYDKGMSLPLKDAAWERRKLIKAMRFVGKTPELIAKCRGIRRSMEKRING